MKAGSTLRSAQGPAGLRRDVMLRAFRWANQHVILPTLHHRTMGTWAGSPVTGYFLTLTTTGRHSGLARETPLNYAILDGRVYLLSGFGTHADWYRNLIADPRVTLVLPGRVLRGTAVRVLDPVEAERAALAVARNSGFALVFEGMNPLTVSDEQLRKQLAGRPVVRISTSHPIYPGRHDPGSRSRGLTHVLNAWVTLKGTSCAARVPSSAMASYRSKLPE